MLLHFEGSAGYRREKRPGARTAPHRPLPPLAKSALRHDGARASHREGAHAGQATQQRKSGKMRQDDADLPPKPPASRGWFSSNSGSGSVFGLSLRSADALSTFEVDQVNLAEQIEQLLEINDVIHSIRIAARPINIPHIPKALEHWTVKINGEYHLVEIDFFERDGAGSFNVRIRCSSPAEAEDFLFYKKYLSQDPFDPYDYTLERYTIVACVDPSLPAGGRADDEPDPHREGASAEERAVLRDPPRLERSMADLGGFLRDWARDNKAYKNFSSNCQHFARDAFEFVVGDLYPHKAKRLRKRVQGPNKDSAYRGPSRGRRKPRRRGGRARLRGNRPPK